MNDSQLSSDEFSELDKNKNEMVIVDNDGEFENENADENANENENENDVDLEEQTPNESSVSQLSPKNELMNLNKSMLLFQNSKQNEKSQQSSPVVNINYCEKDKENNDNNNNDNNSNALKSVIKFYNPRDYNNLQVTKEIQKVFEVIEQFEAEEIELETQLKPFIPQYLPSIGNIETFIKPPRPDGNKDLLGLNFLDEPKLQQSDPSTLDLQLRMYFYYIKHVHKYTTQSINSKIIRSIERADKNPQKITHWIENIQHLHTNVLHNGNIENNLLFNKPMPEISQLMQPLDEKFDIHLQKSFIVPVSNNAAPIILSYDIDFSLFDYSSYICAILDIPVYDHNHIVPALHLLFQLYLQFQQLELETKK
ncbi:hypothetical protein RFI_19454 [Reticulomyxa filosa]|uniref:Uncharacterized protein n=1 Tax=Reticulomyxa filosa TaxID=46433 RepID=X6MVL0_RETFI|nr:hypothetical protein RFI_19454 [Reticulomyxa filosa]|eukprot:ETO17859.1 hypothetical protein RFI_19454 [Reticulomyxa filosa]